VHGAAGSPPHTRDTTPHTRPQGYQFNTFGEVVACWLQDVILVALVFRDRRTPLWAVGGTAAALAAGCAFLLSPACPAALLASLQASNIAIMALGSRLPQILLNMKRGNAGMLSVTTCVLNVLGNAARIFTTLVLTGDLLMLGGACSQGMGRAAAACQAGRGCVGWCAEARVFGSWSVQCTPVLTTLCVCVCALTRTPHKQPQAASTPSCCGRVSRQLAAAAAQLCQQQRQQETAQLRHQQQQPLGAAAAAAAPSQACGSAVNLNRLLVGWPLCCTLPARPPPPPFSHHRILSRQHLTASRPEKGRTLLSEVLLRAVNARGSSVARQLCTLCVVRQCVCL
jgi:hypothetical protein